MATANVSNKAALAGTEKRHREEKPSAEEAPAAVVAPEVTRFPTDLDGASHGPVWKSVGVPLKADPANNPNSDEWDQARQAFKETGLLKRVTSELG